MSRVLGVLILLAGYLSAFEVEIESANYHDFKEKFTTNAKIVQLSNAKESIGSIVAGHLEKYYVKPAQIVKAGQRVALINSMEISKMSAEFLSYKKQLRSIKTNYKATQKLYKQGMLSLQELNNQTVLFNDMSAKLDVLKSQLTLLGIKTEKLQKSTSKFVLYAHTGGVVNALLKPLHSSVDKNDALIELVKDEYYLQTYIPLKYASLVVIGDKVVADLESYKLSTSVTMIMPNVDEITQRVKVLSVIKNPKQRLFTNSFLEATLYFGKSTRYIAVKKTALSFFNNEWVVFTLKEHDEEEEEHQEHEHEHEKEEHHDELPYSVNVLKIITQDDEYVAVEGLHSTDEYISNNSYFIKSILLKGSLGGHGH